MTTVPGWPRAAGFMSVARPRVSTGGSGISLYHQSRYSARMNNHGQAGGFSASCSMGPGASGFQASASSFSCSGSFSWCSGSFSCPCSCSFFSGTSWTGGTAGGSCSAGVGTPGTCGSASWAAALAARTNTLARIAAIVLTGATLCSRVTSFSFRQVPRSMVRALFRLRRRRHREDVVDPGPVDAVGPFAALVEPALVPRQEHLAQTVPALVVPAPGALVDGPRARMEQAATPADVPPTVGRGSARDRPAGHWRSHRGVAGDDDLLGGGGRYRLGPGRPAPRADPAANSVPRQPAFANVSSCSSFHDAQGISSSATTADG